jgi:ABC-type glutathione transport system ATPase component
MTPTETTSLLEVENLTVAFEETDTVVLSDLNFTLHRNEILGVVGETGSGKSMLARALINLLPSGGRVVRGDVRFRGRSIFAMSPKEQRKLRGGRIALIATNAKALLDPVSPVGGQLAEVMRAHCAISKNAALRASVELLNGVGIVDPERCALAYPHQLSGGMAQRVVIAMALIAGPEVLLADDATLGLDATIQVQVLDLLAKRSRKLGLATLLITHDLGIVAHYCDRVAIMRQGRIVELSPVARFLNEPQEEESVALLQAAKARPALSSTGSDSGILPLGMSVKPLIEVDGLVKHFPIRGTREVVRAVDGVSFSIQSGNTLALVGESGSGKTTVGLCLVRLLAPDNGIVRFDGEDIIGKRECEFRQLRRRIQMVLQEPYITLNPRWRVEDLIAEPLQLEPDLRRKDRPNRIRELLAMVHLPASLASAFPHQLTAGEQKRVGIARALATSPDFVVFDEPTTALDIRVRAQIIDVIRELQAGIGLTALFITHDLNSVRSLAQFVAVMRLGKIVEYGPAEAIFLQPQHPYTRTLLSAELPIEAGDERLAHLHGPASAIGE